MHDPPPWAEPTRAARAGLGHDAGHARSAPTPYGGERASSRERQYDGWLGSIWLTQADHAAADVHGVGEAGALDDRERLGRADAGLAVQDDLLVLRQLARGRCR